MENSDAYKPSRIRDIILHKSGVRLSLKEQVKWGGGTSHAWWTTAVNMNYIYELSMHVKGKKNILRSSRILPVTKADVEALIVPC